VLGAVHDREDLGDKVRLTAGPLASGAIVG